MGICLVFMEFFPFSDTELMEIEEESEPPVTSLEAVAALKILQRYADLSANPVIQLLCEQMDDVLAKERIKNLKQKNLLHYFSSNTSS